MIMHLSKKTRHPTHVDNFEKYVLCNDHFVANVVLSLAVKESGFLLLCRIHFPWLFPDFSRQNE